MRPPTLCPKPALDSLRSRLRRISSISRSYLFGIPVLFLELARTLFVLMIPTSQLRDKGFFSQFADDFSLLLPLILFYMGKLEDAEDGAHPMKAIDAGQKISYVDTDDYLLTSRQRDVPIETPVGNMYTTAILLESFFLGYLPGLRRRSSYHALTVCFPSLSAYP